MKQLNVTKIIIALITILLIIPFVSDSVLAQSRTTQKVYDEAGLLTKEEIANLEELAEEYGENHQTDFIIITSADADGKDVEIFMADRYDEMGFGYDKEAGNTVMFVIDMEERDFYLSSFHESEKYLGRERLDKIRDKVIPDMSNGDYYGAFETYLKTANRYMDFKPGVNPDNIFFKTWFQFVASLGLGAIIVFTMASHSRTKKTTTARTYRNEKTTKVLGKQDIYIRTSVSKTRKPQNNSGGGGGGSSGGGGGRTSGGSSYSGSRGSF